MPQATGIMEYWNKVVSRSHFKVVSRSHFKTFNQVQDQGGSRLSTIPLNNGTGIHSKPISRIDHLDPTPILGLRGGFEMASKLFQGFPKH